MNAFSIIVGIGFLLQLCLSFELDEAARVLYYYTAYDIDVTVNGVGQGYISPDCKGSATADGRCTLDEFINFIFLDETSLTPEYYTLLDDEFYFGPSDVASIIGALGVIKSNLEPGMEEDKVIKGRRSPIGFFNDIGTIIDKDYERAGLLKIDISRHWGNMQQALTGLRDSQKAVLQTGLAGALDRINGLEWSIATRHSDYLERLYTGVDWELTIKDNPDLFVPSSDLYKNAVKALQDYDELEATRKQKTMAYKTKNLLNACFM
jgi:hypothetical protein